MIEEFTRSLTGSAEEPALRLTRRYEAPPADLWTALTEPARLRRWLGEVTGSAADGFRVIFADAPDEAARVSIEQCAAPSLLVARWEWEDERPSSVSVHLAPDGDGTVLTFVHRLAEPEHIASYGGGWEQCFASLAARFGGDPPHAGFEPAVARRWSDMQRRAVELSIDLPAPPERVWPVLVSEDGLRSWWWSHWEDVEISADARPGGRYRIAAPKEGIVLDGRYLDLEAPNHLAFTWRWSDAEGTSRDEACDIVITPAGAGSRLTVRHTGPWSSDKPAESYRQGWEFTLGQLRRVLTG